MTTNPGSVDPDEFRTAMRRWATGVTIVTAKHNHSRHGMTVSSYISVSLEPPLVLISLEQNVKTTKLIHASGVFGVSILGEDQQMISDRFAGRIPEIKNRFAGLEFFTLKTGAPLLATSLATFDCQVVSAIDAGTHTLFLGEVLDLRIGGNKKPLIYFDRGYRTIDR